MCIGKYWPTDFSILACGVLAGLLLIAATAPAAAQTTVIIATTNQDSPRVTGTGTALEPRRPGWQVELLRLAGEKASVRFEFRRMLWKQALERVRSGDIDGAFNSSFKEERAVFGVYPTKNGKLDTSRATLNYTYWLYKRADSNVSWNGSSFGSLSKSVGAETSSAVVSDLEKGGATVKEAGSYPEILRMLTEGRVDAIAGFEGNVDILLQNDPQRYRGIVRHPVPIVRKTGYLMFSKHFYARDRETAERIWNAIAEVWSSPAAAEIRRSYE